MDVQELQQVSANAAAPAVSLARTENEGNAPNTQILLHILIPVLGEQSTVAPAAAAAAPTVHRAEFFVDAHETCNGHKRKGKDVRAIDECIECEEGVDELEEP